MPKLEYLIPNGEWNCIFYRHDLGLWFKHIQCSHLDFENSESQRHLLEKVGVPQCKFEEILGKTGVPCPKVGVKDSKYGVNEKPDIYFVLQLYKHTNIYDDNTSYGIRTEAKSL